MINLWKKPIISKVNGGEEVRFMDIPASDPNSPGIFDGNIEPAPGKTLRETTKELVETLKVNAIKHQGYAFRELQERYVNDPHGLERLKTYKEQFERDAVLPEAHNAYYRVRTNFAAMYAAAALAIDYEILPWKKRPTFRAIEKCMRLALATLATGRKGTSGRGARYRYPSSRPDAQEANCRGGVGNR